MAPGDTALSDSWLSSLYVELVGAILLFCGDQRVAEDVAHQALIKLWQRRDKVQPRASGRTPELGAGHPQRQAQAQALSLR